MTPKMISCTWTGLFRVVRTNPNHMGNGLVGPKKTLDLCAWSVYVFLFLFRFPKGVLAGVPPADIGRFAVLIYIYII